MGDPDEDEDFSFRGPVPKRSVRAFSSTSLVDGVLHQNNNNGRHGDHMPLSLTISHNDH